MDTHEHAWVARFVGIDVSQAWLDVARRPGGESWRCAQDEAGITEVGGRRHPLTPPGIVLEATGGLERLLVAALAVARRPGAVVNPPQVRDCAKASGRLATTAALDAAALAHFAQARRPEPRPLPDAQRQTLAALVDRRRQLGALRTAEQNRRHTALAAVRPHVQAHLAWLDQARDDLDQQLDQTLPASPLGRAREPLLRTVKGVGPVVAPILLAERPALGHGSAKRLAAWAGVAPLNRDSGPWRGTRAVWGGRRHVRQARDRAALVGVRHHPVLRPFYERLLARGQPKQVALTACMHKRLTILHALLRDHVAWQPAPAP